MKKVYIIGAGASIDHSKKIFPDIRGIFRKIAEEGILASGLYEQLISYVKEKFDKNIIDEKVVVDAEKIYTAIEIEIEHNFEKGVILKGQFVNLLVQIFSILQKKQVDPSGSYSKFREIIKPEDVVITFNWDILLDNILGREKFLWIRQKSSDTHNKVQKQPEISIDPHYEAFYRSFSGQTKDHHMVDIAIPDPIKIGESAKDVTGIYIKLHGSIDWKICSNEGCRAYGLILPRIDPITEYKCGECREKLETLIIPPTLNKPIRKIKSIRKLWNFAVDAIQNAEHIIVWGYGLPQTDFYAEWLLRGSKRNCQHLTIINKLVKTKEGKVRESFVNRFRNIYDSQTIEVDLHRNFLEYCKR